MKDLKIRLVRNRKELEQIFKLREIIFIKGQRVPKQRERDQFDKTSKHVIVLYKNNPVGCARIRFINKKVKLERIGLLRKYRSKGFGKMVTQYLVNYCKKKNVKEIVVHSQYYIKAFYKKFGFKQRGKTFMDAGIKHVEMYLKT